MAPRQPGTLHNILLRRDGSPVLLDFGSGTSGRRGNEPLVDGHSEGRVLAARTVFFRQSPARALVGYLCPRCDALPRGRVTFLWRTSPCASTKLAYHRLLQ